MANIPVWIRKKGHAQTAPFNIPAERFNPEHHMHWGDYMEMRGIESVQPEVPSSEPEEEPFITPSPAPEDA